VPRYRELYKRGAYAPVEERRRLARMVRRGGGPGSFRSMGERERAQRQDSSPQFDHHAPAPAAPMQQTLF
jgi:hypothetical protein